MWSLGVILYTMVVGRWVSFTFFSVSIIKNYQYSVFFFKEKCLHLQFFILSKYLLIKWHSINFHSSFHKLVAFYKLNNFKLIFPTEWLLKNSFQCQWNIDKKKIPIYLSIYIKCKVHKNKNSVINIVIFCLLFTSIKHCSLCWTDSLPILINMLSLWFQAGDASAERKTSAAHIFQYTKCHSVIFSSCSTFAEWDAWRAYKNKGELNYYCRSHLPSLKVS